MKFLVEREKIGQTLSFECGIYLKHVSKRVNAWNRFAFDRSLVRLYVLVFCVKLVLKKKTNLEYFYGIFERYALDKLWTHKPFRVESMKNQNGFEWVFIEMRERKRIQVEHSIFIDRLDLNGDVWRARNTDNALSAVNLFIRAHWLRYGNTTAATGRC